jgi:hypothetical protein
VEVVLAADVLVGALARVSPDAVRFPQMPPKTNAPLADAVGAFPTADDDFALNLSTLILGQVATALADRRGLAWGFESIDAAVDVLVGLVSVSGGRLFTPLFTPVPTGLSTSGAAALRTAASKELSFPRAVVTEESALLRLRDWRPEHPFPKGEQIAMLSARQFRDLVERARWRPR